MKRIKEMEYIDVYDAQKRKTSAIKVRGEKPLDGEYFLVVHVGVINSEGKLLIQQRAKEKAQFGGAWDLSAGGFAQAGETSEEAVRRELREEIGIEAGEDLQFLFTEPFQMIFDDMYVLRRDVQLQDLILQKGEIDQAAWADCEEIIGMIRDGNFVDYPEECIRKLMK
jgi:mutator protein MutT